MAGSPVRVAWSLIMFAGSGLDLAAELSVHETAAHGVMILGTALTQMC